jgi:MoaA/NifB/PqqE/SkfB family radical SAM enzyme
MNPSAFFNTVTTRAHTMPIVILYVTAGCNLKCVMCSYREPLPNELTLEEITNLAAELARFGLRQIVYSGGEPLLRRDLPAIAQAFQSYGVRQSLLTNGLLLHKRFTDLKPFLNEIIVSLDGPTGATHNRIRGLEAFDQILLGIETVVSSMPRPRISLRTVVQRLNFRELGNMVALARKVGVDRISFLAADVRSNAFHRDVAGLTAERAEVMLAPEETREFRRLMEEFVVAHRHDIERGFIAENPSKLFHLVQYFEALVGMAPLPRNVCNAPMVSTVITSTGDLLPCYFLPPFGNIRSSSLDVVLNTSRIRATRKLVREYSLQQCHECVCTLNIRPTAALFGRL